MVHKVLDFIRQMQTAVGEYPPSFYRATILLALLLAVYLVPVSLFAWLVEEVIEGETLAIDGLILGWIHLQQTPAATAFFQIITEFGGVYILGMAVVAIMAWCWIQGRKKAALMVGVSVGGAAVINLVLKAIFQRDRPDLWQHLITETGYSFPSGHAMASAALVFSCVFLVWRTRFRWLGLVAGGTYMILVGISRMYLGVHYPSDIITGWCVSFIWVSLVALLLYSYSLERQRRRKKHTARSLQ